MRTVSDTETAGAAGNTGSRAGQQKIAKNEKQGIQLLGYRVRSTGTTEPYQVLMVEQEKPSLAESLDVTSS